MLYRIGLAALLLLLTATGLFAQNATIQGTVYYEGDPAASASVALFRNGAFITGQNTDEQGNFQFSGLDAGDYEVIGATLGSKDTIKVGNLGSSETRPVEVQIGTATVTVIEVTADDDPLVKQDQPSSGQTYDSEANRLNADRGLNTLVSQTAGIASNDNGSSLNFRGGRASATEVYVDGVRIVGGTGLTQAATGQVEVITGGTPPWFGDLTSGAINITTTSPASRHTFGGEVVSSQFTDPYNYNLFALNASGPVLSKTDSVQGTEYKRPVVSYFIAGEYETQLDDDPSAIGVAALKNGVLEDLQQNPVTLGPDGNTFISRANFISDDDIERVDVKENNERQSLRLNGRLDFSLNQNTILRVGGTWNRVRNNGWNYRASLFSPGANGYFKDDDYRGYIRFQQQFQPEGGQGLIKNIRYNLQFDYTRNDREQMDENFGNDLFRYGHVGTFNNQRAELYQQVNPGDALYNPEIGQSYYQTAGFVDTAFTFDPSTSSNPILANYNNAIYDFLEENPRDKRFLVNTLLYPPFQIQDPVYTQTVTDASDLIALGGILNGFTTAGYPTLNIYSLWEGMGTNYGAYIARRNELYRATGQASIVLGEQGENQHDIRVGFEFDQRVNRLFFVSAPNLWVFARNQTNRHLANFDTSAANIDYEPYGGTFLAHASPLYAANDQSEFDRNLRAKLGLPVDGTDYINVDELDPEMLEMSMFSADELYNGLNRNSYQYYGYSFAGDLVDASSEEGSFFANPLERPQDAYQPTYIAGYIHDKFQLDRIFLNLGVRVDRFDANQQVLKDKFALVPTFTAPETAELLGTELPGFVEDDWVAYVDDRSNPTQILGYRDEDRWFGADGEAISPRRLEVNGQVQPHIRADSISLDAFTDYEPQINVMPRISFSFPITDRANFFAHYDVLTQRPTAASILYYSDYLFIEQNATASINNPALTPERTIDYEVGMNQLLDADGKIALKISAYYREMRDMIQIVRNTNAYPITYDSFENLDFATVKGFAIEFFTRRLGIVRLNTSYTLQFAEGTGSSFSSSRAALNGVEGFTVLRTLLPLSFDQRHTIAGNIDVRWLEQNNRLGPEIFGVYPLKNFGFSVTYNIASGRPFTRNALPNQADVQFGVNSTSQVEGTPFGSRLPFNYRVDVRIDKNFYIKTGQSTEDNSGGMFAGRKLMLNVYCVFLNVLNRDNILGVYQFSGLPDDSGFLQSAQGEVAIENNNLGDPQAFIDQFRVKEKNPNNYSLPRRIRLGVAVSF